MTKLPKQTSGSDLVQTKNLGYNLNEIFPRGNLGTLVVLLMLRYVQVSSVFLVIFGFLLKRGETS